MANQVWKSVDRTFEDAKIGLRLQVHFTHGGMEHTTGRGSDARYSPTTWGRIAILPNKGESVPDFAKRIDATEAYENWVEQMGSARAADADIRKNGIGIVTDINTQAGFGGMWNSEQVMEELSEALSAQKKPLSPKMAKGIKAVLDEHLTEDKKVLLEAQRAFARTGGKSDKKAAL
jgi:hypothetical protein